MTEKELPPTLPIAGLLHLFVVYTVWSSTYLFIRMAVGESGGFPPFYLGASRMVVCALILIGFAWLKGRTIRLSRSEVKTVALSGLLLWVGANGLVMWAEQYANSGFTALMVAAAPIWTAVIGAVLERRRPSALLIGSLLFGFAGLAVLMAPSLVANNRQELVSGIVLFLASISWAAGSIIQTRQPVTVSPPVSSGYQHAFASVGFLLVALLAGEPWPAPTTIGWLSWAYLALFGSILAFTSFVYTLKLLPLSIAMTYAYVNPVLALLLGWWFLDEAVSGWTLAGAAMVIVGVVGVFKARR